MPENEGEDLWDENSQQQMDQVWNFNSWSSERLSCFHTQALNKAP